MDLKLWMLKFNSIQTITETHISSHHLKGNIPLKYVTPSMLSQYWAELSIYCIYLTRNSNLCECVKLDCV